MGDGPLENAGPIDAAPADALYTATYDLLRSQARRLIATESPGHTLQATALVHEAYLRLSGTDSARWQSRAHFMAVASRAMRRVLIDHARTRSRGKRGRGWDRVTLHDELAVASAGSGIDLLDMIHLDNALQELERQHERLARVAEMRLFGGMAMDEIAAGLGVSLRTAEGDWSFVRRWLAAAMAADGRQRGTGPS
jgi:RNA polymerase sigma factor (TIGR02999 family)